MKNWEILNKSQITASKTIKSVLEILLENRKLTTKKDIADFLNPKLTDVTIKNVEIDEKSLEKAVKRVKEAIKNKQHIIVFGDYDVDGITGAAIWWETLNANGANILPYIP